jgi:hypothetical protein
VSKNPEFNADFKIVVKEAKITQKKILQNMEICRFVHIFLRVHQSFLSRYFSNFFFNGFEIAKK